MKEEINTVDREAMATLVHSFQEGEAFCLRVTGRSMMPLLFHDRSTVTLVRQRDYKPRKGDIVLFCRSDGAFVLHRVHGVEPNGILVINGDAQTWTERILPTQVVARVTGFCRRRKEVSVDSPGCSPGYRIYRALWCPLRFLHPLGARAVYVWHRIPEKLFPRKNH